MERKEETQETFVDLRRLGLSLWRRIWAIILAIAVCGVGAYFYSATMITPTYRTSFTAYVNNRIEMESMGQTNYSDLSTSIGLAYLYEEIITSRSVLMEAAQKCGISWGESASMVTTSVAENAAIIQVFVEATDPDVAVNLAQAITEVAPDQVARVVDGSSMRIVDPPLRPSSKYSPSNRRNAVCGALVGAVLSAIAVIVLDMLNNKVRIDDDLQSRYGLAIMGTIPDVTQTDKHHGEYSYRRTEEGRR